MGPADTNLLMVRDDVHALLLQDTLARSQRRGTDGQHVSLCLLFKPILIVIFSSPLAVDGILLNPVGTVLPTILVMTSIRSMLTNSYPRTG